MRLRSGRRYQSTYDSYHRNFLYTLGALAAANFGPRPKSLPTGGKKFALPAASSVPKPKAKKGTVTTRGSYSGKMKPKRKNTSDAKYYKYGSIIKTESGGRVEAEQCAYIKHCNSVKNDMAYAFMGAIVTKLLQGTGRYYRKDSDGHGLPVGTLFRIPRQLDGASGNIDYTVVSGKPLVSDIISGLVTAARVPASGEVYQLGLAQINISGTAEATLDLENVMIDIKTVSRLKIQNQTEAQDDTPGIEVDPTNRNDIENNPLCGYIYGGSKKWSNVSGTVDFGVPNPTSGINTIIIDSKTDRLTKPPRQPFLFGTRKCSWVKLEPGNIKSAVALSEAKMYINTFLVKTSSYMFFESATCAWGSYNIVGFEKLLDVNSQRKVNLAYQVDNTTMICASTHVPRKFATVVRQ